jgi:hypothetical protein
MGSFKEHNRMSTAYDVKYPENMVNSSRADAANWAESTLQSVVDSVEEYARAKPVSFAMWTFGIGFMLGWKLKPW